jgi:hypothetical protein
MLCALTISSLINVDTTLEKSARSNKTL